jgi:hypothetical protein
MTQLKTNPIIGHFNKRPETKLRFFEANFIGKIKPSLIILFLCVASVWIAFYEFPVVI